MGLKEVLSKISRGLESLISARLIIAITPGAGVEGDISISISGQF